MDIWEKNLKKGKIIKSIAFEEKYPRIFNFA
jgi:hypothetical protein